MFFSIVKEQPSNFTDVIQVGNLYIGTDSGWHKETIDNKTFIFKGYADSANLKDLLRDINNSDTPTFTGNFCVLVYSHESGNISIKSDRYRAFPIFYDQSREVTNLKKLDHAIWTDSVITISQDLDVTETKFDVIGEIDTSPLTFDQALNIVDQILRQKTQQFLSHNTLPIRVFLSGGIDSLLVYSYLQQYTDNYDLVNCEHFDFDRFWMLNSGHIKKHWAYAGQIHHWTDPCVLTSGAPGDEFMLRSPTTANLLLLSHNTSILELLEQPSRQQCLHYSYFKLPKHVELFKNQTPMAVENSKDLYWNLCNILVNDFQHWHIGNTLTWTPLRDLEIFKTILRLPIGDQKNQILDSKFSKELIERNSSGLTKLLSDQKNANSPMSNLVDFILK